MTVVAVMNYKGGVGKTTLTANLGADIANRGGTVLLIDLDPQASLTFSFYESPEDWDQDRTIYRWYESFIMSGSPKALEDLILTPPRTNELLSQGRLDLISSDLRLGDVELDLAHSLGGARYQTFNPDYLRTYRLLADALTGKAFGDYDVILIDCPPSFNMVTRTAVVACEHILVPAKADYLSTLGIQYLRARLTRLVQEYNLVAGGNPAVAINPVLLGVVFMMVQHTGSGLLGKLQGYINGLADIEVPILQSSLRESKAVFADHGKGGIPALLAEGLTENVEYDLQQITSEFLARIRV